MEKPVKITAVCGWAISPVWFADLVEKCFPGAEVRAVYPLRPADSREAETLLNDQANLYIGYSLGSLWLLHHRRYIPQKTRKALLAPILSFTKEDKMGGKIPARQLKYLLRELARNPQDNSPLYDFYSRCDLPIEENFFREIPTRSALTGGLDFLGNTKVEGKTTKDFLCLLGDNDPLLDGRELKRHIPHLQIVKGAKHAPQNLLQHLADHLDFQETNSSF